MKLFPSLIILDFKTNKFGKDDANQRLKPEKLKTFAKNLSYNPKNRRYCEKNFK